jgi:hypothetical protein
MSRQQESNKKICISKYRGPYVGFQMLNFVVFDLINEVFTKPHTKKNPGFNPGDLGGLAIGTPLLINLTGIM